MQQKANFKTGLWHGVPIALGYLFVSFGFGISAVAAGISILASVGISLTNLTSAGQVAGIAVIAAGGSVAELALTQLVINIRYSLMGIALTQKLCPNYSKLHRMITSFGITDEVFGVASSRDFEITPSYMYGLILLPIVGWTMGTLLGAVAGNILPEKLSAAMGIMIYGMFVAIVVPEMKKTKPVILAVAIAAGVSVLLHYVFTFISAGFSIVISGVVASAITALFFPIKEDTEE